MLDDFKDRLEQGAHNLLINCAQCEQGDVVLIVYETEQDGYYDPDLAGALGKAAADLGIKTTFYGVPFNHTATCPDAALNAQIEEADCTVYLARLGDQIRFQPKTSETKQIMSYALDRDMLASPFGGIDYQAFTKLKDLINTAMASTSDIHVTCPAGTDFRGTPNDFNPTGCDTTLQRFPVSVFAPIPAQGFSGRIAQVGFLTGTGSNFYTPATCPIKETLFVKLDGSRITGFEGSAADVAAAQKHYEFVGEKYNIDTYYVHSWHAGIHPSLAYTQDAAQNFERWSGGAFGNPRLLHFHTCGGYPPGEISINVLDPTVRIDGVAVWENGRLHPERLVGGEALLSEYPVMQAAFDTPETAVGQARCGRLAYA